MKRAVRSLFLTAVGLLGSVACSERLPTAPSEPLIAITRPTPAGGAPVFTFLGDAAKCASAAHDSVETVVEDAVELGMVVWSPDIFNACDGPVDMSEDTLEIYATEDRTSAPVFAVVNPGSTRIGGTAGERTCGGCGCGTSMGFKGPFPLEFSPEQVAFRVTLESDAPIAVTPGCR